MPYCINCGNHIEGHLSFCTKCGTRQITKTTIPNRTVLKRLPDAVLDPLLDQLHSSNPNVWGPAIDSLTRMGEKAVAGLAEKLSDEDWRVRGRAVEVLGRIGSAQTVGPLIQALSDSDSTTRSTAVSALGKIGDGRAIEPLKPLLRDPQEFIRNWTKLALKTLDGVVQKGIEPPPLPTRQLLDTKANAKSLVESGLLSEFVKQQDGAWNHEGWLGFVSRVRATGYSAIPEVELGRLLEDEKGRFTYAKTHWARTNPSNTIKLKSTPENRYVKQVFDHLAANFREKSFGYEDLPGSDPGAQSAALVILKQLGLRESVGYKTFELSAKGKETKLELS